MNWKWNDARTKTCDMFYLEDEEGTILEVTAVTALANPHLDLIKSAPNLLEALEKIDTEAHNMTPELWEATAGMIRLIAQEAINKARGV